MLIYSILLFKIYNDNNFVNFSISLSPLLEKKKKIERKEKKKRKKNIGLFWKFSNRQRISFCFSVHKFASNNLDR